MLINVTDAPGLRVCRKTSARGGRVLTNICAMPTVIAGKQGQVIIDQALARLATHGAFVGLTDYYVETACLFHRMVCKVTQQLHRT